MCNYNFTDIVLLDLYFHDRPHAYATCGLRTSSKRKVDCSICSIFELSVFLIPTLTEVPLAILMLHIMTMSESILVCDVIIVVELNLSNSIVNLDV